VKRYAAGLRGWMLLTDAAPRSLSWRLETLTRCIPEARWMREFPSEASQILSGAQGVKNRPSGGCTELIAEYSDS
jgi:hypothetical protein